MGLVGFYLNSQGTLCLLLGSFAPWQTFGRSHWPLHCEIFTFSFVFSKSRGIRFSLHKRELALPPCRMFATHSRVHDALPLIKPTRHISDSRNRTPARFSLSLSKLFSFGLLFSRSKAFHHKQIHFRQTLISLPSHFFACSSIGLPKKISFFPCFCCTYLLLYFCCHGKFLCGPGRGV